MEASPRDVQNDESFRERVLTIRRLLRLAITAPQDVEKLLEICLIAVIDDGEIAETGSVFIRTLGADDKLILLKKAGTDTTVREFRELRIGEGLAGLVASSGGPIISQDCINDGRYKPYSEGPQLRSFIGVPVTCRDTVMGVICAHNLQSEVSFSEDHVQFLQDLANVAAVSILANCNDLTLLPNRGLMNTLLDTEIAFAISRVYPLCLAYIDIDMFRTYNDRYRHDGADQLIQQLGTLMKQNVPANTTLCHRHGDEFAIIFKEQKLAQAAEECDRLIHAVRSNIFSVDGSPVSDFRPLTISIGLAERKGLENREELLGSADVLNQEAKGSGRDQLAIEH